jgi:peptidoglycan L-alanyl-D-glutamate endopeptidase CwlK
LAQRSLIVFSLGPRSKQRLRGVHPDLVKVVERAIKITDVDFTVLEGLRTPERQKALLEAGASQTLNSRHLTGHAVDLGAWVGDEVRWDWPLYHRIAAAIKEAAKQEGVSIVWGGGWRTFKDGPHFELDRKAYP